MIDQNKIKSPSSKDDYVSSLVDITLVFFFSKVINVFSLKYLNVNLNPISQRCLVPSLAEIFPVVLVKEIFESRHVLLLFRYYLLLNKECALESFSSNDAMCQILLVLDDNKWTDLIRKAQATYKMKENSIFTY